MDAKITSLKLNRDSKGNIRPIEGVTPMLSMVVEILPLTYGQSRNYPSFGMAVHEWSDIDKMSLINDHVIVPDVNIETLQEMFDDYDAWVIEDLVHSVIILSGLGRFYEPDEEGNEQDVEG